MISSTTSWVVHDGSVKSCRKASILQKSSRKASTILLFSILHFSNHLFIIWMISLYHLSYPIFSMLEKGQMGTISERIYFSLTSRFDMYKLTEFELRTEWKIIFVLIEIVPTAITFFEMWKRITQKNTNPFKDQPFGLIINPNLPHKLSTTSWSGYLGGRV